MQGGASIESMVALELGAPSADRSVSVAFLLTAAGGFMDAFTFVGHGEVFANSMSGNVVLLGMSIASANWTLALRRIPPILAFLLGVFLAQRLRQPILRRRLLRPALACLSLEILFLMTVSVLPEK